MMNGVIRVLPAVVLAFLVCTCTFRFTIAFTVIQSSTYHQGHIHQDASIQRYSKDTFQQLQKKSTSISTSNGLTLHSVSSSDLTDAIVIATAFAGIAIYTYKNPDTSDKIRDALGGVTETSDTIVVTETAPIPAPVPVAVVAPPEPVVVAVKKKVAPQPVPKSKEQEELSTLLKTVSKTVTEQGAKLQELESKKTVTATTTATATVVTAEEPVEHIESTKPKVGKLKFVLKVVKKAVMPWKAWASL